MLTHHECRLQGKKLGTIKNDQEFAAIKKLTKAVQTRPSFAYIGLSIIAFIQDLDKEPYLDKAKKNRGEKPHWHMYRQFFYWSDYTMIYFLDNLKLYQDRGGFGRSNKPCTLLDGTSEANSMFLTNCEDKSSKFVLCEKEIELSVDPQTNKALLENQKSSNPKESFNNLSLKHDKYNIFDPPIYWKQQKSSQDRSIFFSTTSSTSVHIHDKEYTTEKNLIKSRLRTCSNEQLMQNYLSCDPDDKCLFDRYIDKCPISISCTTNTQADESDENVQMFRCSDEKITVHYR